MVAVAQEAAEVLEADGVSASVINARWIKPVDGNAILGAASAHRLLVTLEESTCMGGYGSAVCEVLADEGVLIPVERIAIPDCFVPHGAMPLLLEDLGLTPDGVASRVLERMARLDA
jgi:1-deoxy-D-xylulose-5-phosphate synthase